MKMKDWPEREPGSHKGENGLVAVIGGSVDYTGAPALAAEAALRTGCDLAKILTSEGSREVVASFSENLIVGSYGSGYFSTGSVPVALELADWADAVVVGPGLGDPDVDALEEFMEKTGTEIVVDADALSAAGELSGVLLTPHAREFEQLSRQVIEDNVVVKTGAEDEIYVDGTKEYTVDAGTPAMTVGGTGDTLTGIIASLVSQGLNREEAAVTGARINGEAGELAAEEYGNGMLPTDLVERIPAVICRADFSS